MISANLRLVVKIAHDYKDFGLPLFWSGHVQLAAALEDLARKLGVEVRVDHAIGSMRNPAALAAGSLAQASSRSRSPGRAGRTFIGQAGDGR